VASASYFLVEKPALRAKRFFAWFDAPRPGGGGWRRVLRLGRVTSDAAR